jgi:hypothetical protein
VDAISPQVHVINLTEIALAEGGQLLSPLARQSLNRGRAQPSFAAEELSHCRVEVSCRDAVHVRHWQDLVSSGEPACPRRQDGSREAISVTRIVRTRSLNVPAAVVTLRVSATP